MAARKHATGSIHDPANRHFGKTDEADTSLPVNWPSVFRPRRSVRRDEPLAGHTTLRVGGPADVYVEPASEEDLAAVVKFCGARGVPFFVIGRGSNLLVRDGGFRGAVICLSHADFSQKFGEVRAANDAALRRGREIEKRRGRGAAERLERHGIS